MVPVVVLFEECCQALDVQLLSGLRARIAAQEGKPQPGVHVVEYAAGTGPEAVQLGAKLACQQNPVFHHVPASAGHRAQRACLIGVGGKGSEAMGVGACQLSEAEGVEGVGLAREGLEARARVFQRGGVDGQDDDAGLQQAVDQNPVGALDGTRHTPRSCILDISSSRPGSE
jgi:hypothetical protein